MRRAVLCVIALVTLTGQAVCGQTPLAQKQKSLEDLEREYSSMYDELYERLTKAYRAAQSDEIKAELSSIIGSCRIGHAAEVLMDDIALFNVGANKKPWRLWPVRESVARLGSAAIPVLLKRIATTPPEDGRFPYYIATLLDITKDKRIVAAYLQVEAEKHTDPAERSRFDAALTELDNPGGIGAKRIK